MRVHFQEYGLYVLAYEGVVRRRLSSVQCFPPADRLEPKQENIGQSDARLIGRLEEGAGQAMFSTFGS